MHSVRKCILSVIKNFHPLVWNRAKHTLPRLPYEYYSLEPILCKEIMEMHHKKHHQNYIDNLNDIEESLKECSEKC